MNNFCAFICTHGRPDKQTTYEVLRKAGYKEKIYFVLDDQDNTIQEYIDRFGAENILVFNKNYYINSVDTGVNRLEHKCNLFPKSAMDNIATKLGLDSYVMMDDDVLDLSFRYVDGDKLRRVKVKSDADTMFKMIADFMVEANISTLGLGYPGMFFVGADLIEKNLVERFRIPYQIVFRNLAYSVKWTSYVWEDTITGVEYLKRGEPWFVFPYLQQQTQVVGKNSCDGGMHDLYNGHNTLQLYMENIKYNPSSVKVKSYKEVFANSVSVDNSFVKLISGRYKK